MKLLEHQGKRLLREAGIRVPGGVHVTEAARFSSEAADAPYPAVVKAQVLTGGRGKAGGIQFAADATEAEAHTKRIIGMQIGGLRVESVYIEERLDVAKELYAAFLIDRSTRKSLLLFSPDGGVDIESVPESRIARVIIDPLSGFRPFHVRQAMAVLDERYTPEERKAIAGLLATLYQAFKARDCELLEVNPLVVTADGDVVAADAKVIVNDSARFRQRDIEAAEEEDTELEREARRENIAFIQLEGTIGVIANGAGLTMATLDALNEYGGNAGVFLDLGGTDDPEQVARAMRLMKKARPSLILVNLFGGITKCDTVARGIRNVMEQEGLDCPVVARIKGTNEKEAKEILKDAGFVTTDTLQDAARQASKLEQKILKEVS